MSRRVGPFLAQATSGRAWDRFRPQRLPAPATRAALEASPVESRGLSSRALHTETWGTGWVIMMSEQIQREMLARLRRIEGQARGVQRMIEDDRDCLDILAQLSSLRSAAYGASVALTEQYAMQCLAVADGRESPGRASPDEAVRSLVEVLLRTPH